MDKNEYAYKSLSQGGPEEAPVILDGVHLPDSVASKCASEIKDFVKGIKPDKDHSYVHLISTGAWEWYGPNKRGDSFNETGGKYKPSEPYCKEAAEVELDGGLKKYHDATFKANGKVYREHHSIVENSNNKPLGDVVFAAYNEPMHRGELVVRLANDEWKDDLERISKGKPCYYSMGCLTKDDVCSVCGKRTSPNDKKNRCEHLKDHLLQYTDKGVQVHALTDHPIFYDISRVARPADKIAYSLGKVASEKDVMPPPSAFLLDRAAGVRTDRLSLMFKIAEEEKSMREIDKIPVEDVDEEDKSVIKKIPPKDSGKVLVILKRHNTMLPPPVFLELLAGDDAVCHRAMPLIGDHLDGIFSRMLKEGDLGGFLDDGTYDDEDDLSDRQLEELVAPLIRRYSLDDEPYKRRIIRITIKPGRKVASEGGMIITPAADLMAGKLAREYARYQLSFLTAHPDRRTIRQVLSGNHSNVQTWG